MTKRQHRNKLTRLTAKERAVSFFEHPQYAKGDGVAILEKIIQAHAREAVRRAVIRYRRKHPTQDDKLAAVESVLATNWSG